MTDLDEVVSAQLEEMRLRGELEVRPEPRCRICKEESLRVMVNKMLAHGMTLRDIQDVVEPFNRERPVRERIHLSSIRKHRRKHFDVQRPANAVYRAIIERRARELGLDFEAGVGTAINHLSYLDTMMVKGYQTLIAEDTVVSYRDGMDASLRLNELVRKDSGAIEQARMMAEMDRVISVVKEVCSPEQLAIMGARLNGEAPAVPTPSSRPAAPSGDDAYDPADDWDDDDDDLHA